MAAPRIFVSSTCYDLNQVRDQMRSFLQSFGYEPIMSEYSDVLYDPRTHTHENCVEDVRSCDMVVLFIGARFGGGAVPEAIDLIDWEALRPLSKSLDLLDKTEKISVTQLEIFSAIENGIPVFSFVEERVLHDHHVYEKNKEKSIIDEMDFPSIDKRETAKYIFNFINFLRFRLYNNSIVSFGKFKDIQDHLVKQWASLFQRLIRESIHKEQEDNKSEVIIGKLESLEAALITTIVDEQAKRIARNVIKFRRLFDFLLAVIGDSSRSILYTGESSFREFLRHCKIVEIKELSGDDVGRWRSALILEDGTYYGLRMSVSYVTGIESDWGTFSALSSEDRRVISDAMAEQETRHMGFLQYVPSNFSVDYPEPNSNLDDEIPF